MIKAEKAKIDMGDVHLEEGKRETREIAIEKAKPKQKISMPSLFSIFSLTQIQLEMQELVYQVLINS